MDECIGYGSSVAFLCTLLPVGYFVSVMHLDLLEFLDSCCASWT